MRKIAQFQKVSREEFTKDWKKTFHEEGEEIDRIYDDICLPARATAGSAGYDFFAPLDIRLEPGETITIPTGVRTLIDDGWVLMCFPRSGLGFRYRMQLNNTVGIIDSDYSGSDNEGHIFARITNDTHDGKVLLIERGQGFMQGVFLEFGITEDDAADRQRNGGFGSTT